MKILHLCLAAFYIDNYGYQENILTKMHKKLGFDVKIIASVETFIDKKSLGYISPSSYINEHGIPVVRIPYINIPLFLAKKLRLYKNLYYEIEEFKPDIIFMHDCQFLSITEVRKYLECNPKVKCYVDCHTDMMNSARTFLSREILHKIIYKYCAQLIEPYTKKFYGVLPARVDFLKDIYKLPEGKIELLVMGADDEKVKEARNEFEKTVIRSKYNVKKDDFLIVTGGKIDKNKPQILLLMEAVKAINNEQIKLIVFGSVIEEYKKKFDSLLCDTVIYAGWLDSDDTYKYFSAGDLVVLPGLHSVFWEQAVGLGKPCVFRYIDGFTHIDLGGNCKFLYEDSINELSKLLLSLFYNPKELKVMKEIAEEKGMKYFSYQDIAIRSIDDFKNNYTE